MHKFLVQLQVNSDLLCEYHLSIPCNTVEEGEEKIKEIFKRYGDYDVITITLKE